MIYDVASPQFQQFLKAARRREDVQAKKGAKGGKSMAHKPAGAASTGL